MAAGGPAGEAKIPGPPPRLARTSEHRREVRILGLGIVVGYSLFTVTLSPMFKMGMDPEVVFTTPDNKIVYAGDYLPADGELGRDGHPYLAELRPKPGDTPKELTKNLKKILKDFKDGHPQGPTKKFPEGMRWRAGSFVCDRPIGGHIHFSIYAQDDIITALDGGLAQLLTLLEDEDEAKRRRSGNYGQLHATRDKNWGFEYRTPASFIVSEPITLGVLSLAKALVLEQVDKQPLAIRNLSSAQMKHFVVDPTRYRRCDKAHFYEKLNDIWPLLVKLSYWRSDEGKDLWKYVAGLKDIADKKSSWNNGQDVLTRWKVLPEKRPVPKSEGKVQITVPTTPIPPQRLWDLMLRADAMERAEPRTGTADVLMLERMRGLQG